MKIELIIEKKGKFARIPLTVKEVRNIMDMAFYLVDESDMKKNKINTEKIADKFLHVVNDIMDDGILYKMEEKKFVKLKERHYFKKPQWSNSIKLH